MAGAPHPKNEQERLESLRALGILDTLPEERFDRLTRLARRLFGAPIALLSLVDADRQWFKSRVGLELSETPREHSFCAHAILDEEVLVVHDATRDERFRSNPLVTGAPSIRFYAGCPVRAPDGSALGTLCVIDHEPRDFAEDDAGALRDLAALVEHEIKAISMATTDVLTGLTNRRGFRAIAVHTLAMCQRVDRPATLLLFDLDGFKEVNDELGHAEGDRLLQDFASDLLSTFRDSDVVARLGGDEFCVLLTGTAEADIPSPLALLRDRIRAREHPAGVGFSVGAATYDPARHEGIDALTAEADAKMYEHKRSGALE